MKEQNKIRIIGLGSGDLNQMPLGLYKRIIAEKQTILARTKDHPVIQELEAEGVHFKFYDGLYEQEDNFQSVYEQITEGLLKLAKESSIIYVVPGHPMLAEQTTQLLLAQSDIEIEVLGGQSYLDATFAALKIDPIEGLQFHDATTVNREVLDYHNHLLFCQVYDPFSASELKLLLLEDLPADYHVTIVEAAGSSNEKLTEIPLEELDRTLELSNLTSVYVPPIKEKDVLNHQFNRLRDIMRTLRGPDGCPWDREQTHESIRRYAIEEVYELIDAIDEEDDEGIVEELGDVLLQVMLHCQIGEDDGYFTIDDVIKGVTDKMIHRHPHVFSDVEVNTVDDVDANWEALKKQEKSERESILDGIPRSLPALLRALKLQKKSRKVGFQWNNVDDIWAKLDEELSEFKNAIDSKDEADMEAEIGDVLFVLVNLAIHYKINPEFGLTATNEKFIRRFHHIEETLKAKNIELTDASLKEMDLLWDEAKQKERE